MRGTLVCAFALAVTAGCGPSHRNPGGTGDDQPCTEGQITCDGDTAKQCENGQPTTVRECDTASGETCMDGTGCVNACSPAVLGESYIGCDYYPTVTGNPVNNEFNFAVAISNTSNEMTHAHIEGGSLSSAMDIDITPNSVSVVKLPWVDDLKLCHSTDPDAIDCTSGGLPGGAQVAKGGYHLTTDKPVTVYQFNSYDYSLPDGLFSFTNDASLLQPTNVWRTQYYAAAWPTLAGINPSEMAITAMTDGTTVTITTRANVDASGSSPAFTAGVAQTVTLNNGDVLEIDSNTGDLTGTSVVSNNPVQVISGHYCADVPDGVAACDHMEESMFGVDTLGKTYIVNAPAVTTEPQGKAEIIRIIATAPNTTITYQPEQPGAPTAIANAGDFIEVPANAGTFQISSTEKVLVAQYMQGQDADGAGTGDPAMALAVPVEQFRNDYLFMAPISYESNYLDIIAPSNASITLDGVAVTGFTAIGTTGYSLARVLSLSAGPNADGAHHVNGDQPFGITVYGYGQYTSYWYPGGLNLTTVID